jgi:hypothetical protein
LGTDTAFVMTTNAQSQAVPFQSYYGTKVTGYRLAHTDGARQAPASGPYLGREGKCAANEDTCEGFAIKDSEFCAGHNRKVGKTKKVS